MKTIDKFLTFIETWVSVIAMSVMTIAIFLQVIFRYVIQSALPWSEELARYAMIYLTFIGVSAGTKSMAHFSVTALVDCLPSKIHSIVTLITDFICSVLFVVYFVLAIEMVMSIHASGQITPALQIPMYLIYVSLPLGFAGTIFRYVELMIANIKKIKCPSSNGDSIEQEG